MKDAGIIMYPESVVDSIRPEGEGYKVAVLSGEETVSNLNVEKVMYATGRIPNTECKYI